MGRASEINTQDKESYVNTNGKEFDSLIDEIIEISNIQAKVSLSDKILKKRVSKYIKFVLNKLIAHHPNVLAIKNWGGFSFNSKEALAELGDLGAKRKYGYAWSTFQKEIKFLVLLDKGNNFTQKVSDYILNPKYLPALKSYLKSVSLCELYPNYDQYFKDAEALVPIDVRNLQRILKFKGYNNRGGKHQPLSKSDAAKIELLIQAANQYDGCIPHYYEESSTSRKYGKGMLNLQTLPKRIRYAALPNCYVYDLQAGAYSLLAILAKQVKPELETPFIDKYVKERAYIRRKITNDIFGVDFDGKLSGIIKEAFTAIGFGAKLQTMNQYRKTKDELIFALDKIFHTDKWGNTKTKAFLEHPFVVALTQEYEGVKQVIVSEFKDENYDLELNKGFPFIRLDDGGKQKSNSKMLAHLYQSLERNVLDIMVEVAGNKLLLPVHDGIVTSDKIDLSQLDAKLKGSLGSEILVDVDKLVSGKAVTMEEEHQIVSTHEKTLSKSYFSQPVCNSGEEINSQPIILGTNIDSTGDASIDALIRALNCKSVSVRDELLGSLSS